MKLDIRTTFEDIEIEDIKESDVNQETPLSFPISKGAITKSGDIIRSYMKELDSTSKNTISEEEFRDALFILKRYRENHIPSLKYFSALLEGKLKRLQVFEQSIVSSRSKRLESIANKLVVRPTMRLAQMDDLVGIRVTLPDMEVLDQFIHDTYNCEIINSDWVIPPINKNTYK